MLVSGAVAKVRQVLDFLDCPTLQQGILISDLLTVQKKTSDRSSLNGVGAVERDWSNLFNL